GKKFLSKGSQPYYLKEISPKKGGEGTKCTIKGNLSYWENNTDVFIGNKKMEKLFHSHDSIVFQIPRVNNFGSQPVTLRTHYPEEIILADGLMFELVEP
ncbi:MAG TPA: IPT/TIG domain-containing protein, partial [Bacteroidales bacterium]|nr:IPT/TIG domain-containing protein [Bacteroidales bacterium]